MIPKIIWEDSDLLVVEKPAGTATQPLRGTSSDGRNELRPYKTLAEQLAFSYPELKSVGGLDWGAVHRLDVETSGLVIFARNQKMYDHLREMFSKNEIEKEYTALVSGKIDKPGKINWAIGSDPKSKKRVRVYKNRKEAVRGKAQEAITSYEPHVGAQFIAPGCDESRPYTLLKIQIKTGRRHQIRAHLAAMGHPIVGDELYGKSIGGIEKQGAMNCAPTLHLHASRLKFRHPRTGQLVTVVSSAPFVSEVRESV